jgi:hypothetical protein
LESLIYSGARLRFVTPNMAVAAVDDDFAATVSPAAASLVFADKAQSGERYYLVDHLHESPATVVYQDRAGWALVRLEDRLLNEALKQSAFLWSLPQEYSLRGFRRVEPREKIGQRAPRELVDTLLEEVDSELLREHVLRLALLDPARGSNPENLRTRYAFRAATLESTQYILDRMAEYLGQDRVETQAFEVAGTEMFNVVGVLPGAASAGGYYVVCAHYDATGTRSRNGWDAAIDPAPGADDNATGVALVLETARVLARQQLPWPVRFIAFSGEETGLWGSRAFAGEAMERDDRILGVLNFDMVGFNDRSHRMHVVANPASKWLAQLMIETNQRYGIGLEMELLEDAAALLSDHAPFWARGYDAILGIENYLPTDSTSTAVRRGLYRVNTQYHTVADVPDSINWELLKRSSSLAIALLGQFADPAGLPNLAVFPGDLRVTLGDSLRLRVSNIGLGAAVGIARVRLEQCALDTSGCALVYDTSIELDIAPGDARDIAVPWDRFGESVFRFDVDVGNAIAEVSEEDNLAVQLLRRIPASKVLVFPNPYEIGKNGFVSFSGIPLHSTVKIFGMDGATVWSAREEQQGTLSREVRWEGVNASGFEVTGGVYIYVITGADGRTLEKGKLTVVR